MRKIMLVLILLVPIVLVSLDGTGAAATKYAGEALYKKHCSACHHHASRLKSAKNIIAVIRNPPPYMPSFNEYKLSDDNAIKVADFIHQSSD
jgi:mono/diheme cytochrome c family protein